MATEVAGLGLLGDRLLSAPIRPDPVPGHSRSARRSPRQRAHRPHASCSNAFRWQIATNTLEIPEPLRPHKMPDPVDVRAQSDLFGATAPAVARPPITEQNGGYFAVLPSKASTERNVEVCRSCRLAGTKLRHVSSVRGNRPRQPMALTCRSCNWGDQPSGAADRSLKRGA
jgi:hypothetical protein